MIVTKQSKGSRAKTVCALGLSVLCAFQLNPARAERKVVFPKTPQPVGTAITHPLNMELPLNMIGQAFGTVLVPDGQALYLIATPEGMRYFDSLSVLKPGDIQHLRLHDVNITENNLKTIAKMSGLTALDFSYSDVSDSSIKYITGLKNLKHLDLSSTLVRGMTLNKLKGFKNLHHLDIANTRIHDFAVNTIVESCPNLRRLNLTGTYITDDAMLKLQKLQNLRRLNISKTGVTDKYIDRLLTLKELQRLNVSNTHVSQKKLNELRRAKPSCKLISRETDD
jgi:hypothetical protein